MYADYVAYVVGHHNGQDLVATKEQAVKKLKTG
jgi:hypothetical protein